jgi:HAMP domain-containing protein
VVPCCKKRLYFSSFFSIWYYIHDISLEEICMGRQGDSVQQNKDSSGVPRELDVSTVAADDSSALLEALLAMRRGDFSVRMRSDLTGITGKIADSFNDIVAANQKIAAQLENVGQVVGRDGRTSTRVRFGLSDGSWSGMEGSINTLIDDLVWPTAAVTRTISAVAKGDLLQTVPINVDGRPLKGEFLRSAEIVNTMIKQLSIFTSEVTRVAREVGTDGKLGGQAQVPEVTGVWKDLTESVNSMASNLTAQVRNIADVTIAVANGDLSKKITVDVRGEILQLKEAINTMVDQLRSFASEVTRVAREVGTEGKLGGQALVPGVAGTWKDLTDSVNAMCGNSHGAGPKHRAGDDGRRARRPFA